MTRRFSFFPALALSLMPLAVGCSSDDSPDPFDPFPGSNSQGTGGTGATPTGGMLDGGASGSGTSTTGGGLTTSGGTTTGTSTGTTGGGFTTTGNSSTGGASTTTGVSGGVTTTTGGGADGGATTSTTGEDGGATGMTGSSTTGGDSGTSTGGGTGGLEDNPSCEVPPPSEHQTNPVGPGGSNCQESDHFRICGSGDVQGAINHLEAAHKCFVEDWCFRSPGLAIRNSDTTQYKFNVYSVGGLGAAAGVMQYDARRGLSYVEVISRSLADPRVVVHEYGHSLTLTEETWVDEGRTGAWWEAIANWVADTYLTSPYCEAARQEFGIPEGDTIIDLGRNISQSWRMIVSDQNYYQAWPFITYLTMNPDGYPGLGRMALLEMFRQYPGNNVTPLHALEVVAAPIKVQTILGRYWARMAYLDIGHEKAQARFMSERSRLDFDNLDSAGGSSYRVKSSKRPQYGGANIIPLSVSGGEVSVNVSVSGGGSGANLTATLAIRESGGAVRYVDLPDGAGSASVASGEEASLVVVNTPDTLYQYDAFRAGAPETTGLDYTVELTGATPAN